MRRSFVVAFALVAIAGVGRGGSSSFIELPPSPSEDYHVRNPGKTNFGEPEVIASLQLIGHVWAHDHPEGPKVQVNDISSKEGGPLTGHASHQKGVDADVVTSGPNVTDLSVKQRDKAIELIKLCRRYGADLIFWNGDAKGLAWVQPWPHHDDHIHVRWSLAKRPIPRAVLPEDRRRGVTPLAIATSLPSTPSCAARRVLGPGDEGDDVLEVQKALIANGVSVDKDSVFGPKMQDAVKEFQRSRGLAHDGVVGPATWAALAR